MISLQLELLSFAGSVNLFFPGNLCESLDDAISPLRLEARKDEAARLRPDQSQSSSEWFFFGPGLGAICPSHHPSYTISNPWHRCEGGRWRGNKKEEQWWPRGRKGGGGNHMDEG